MTPQRFASGRFGGVARLPGHQVGRVISNLFGGGSAQELLDSAPFCSELLYTAIPQRAAPGTTATFTRATTSTWQNNDGYLVTGVAGEIGFVGARRVRNLVNTTSENLSNAAWSKGGTFTSPTITTGVTDPLGTTRACTITAVGGDGVVYQAITPPAATGYVAVNSAWIRRRTGTGAVYLRTANNVDVNIASTLTTEWQRFSSVAAGPAAGSWYFVIGVGVAGDAIDVAFCQCENVTAQTTQTAGEYVSVGVPSDWAGDELVTNGTFDSATTGWTVGNSATFVQSSGAALLTNGAASNGYAYQAITTVVGAKYVLSGTLTLGTAAAPRLQAGTTIGGSELGTSQLTASGMFLLEFTATGATTYITAILNSTTLGATATYDNISVKPAYYHGSGVDGVKCYSTDINGAAIPSSTLLGYQAEGARTNLAVQSQTLGTTWATDGSVNVTENQYIAPDGTATMDQITSIAATSQHYLKQGITFSAATTTYSCYLKYVNNQWTALVMSNGGGPLAASFDLLNGVAGALAAGTTSTIQPTEISGVYRVSITGTMSAGAGNVYISPNATNTASLENYTSAGTETVGAWGAQVELGSFASSYIPTTTAAVTRNADVLTYSSAGNILGTAGAAYAEWTFPRAANLAASWRIISAGAGGVASALYLANAASGDLSLFDGTLRDGPTPAYPVNAPTKSASTWGGSAATITNAGTSVTTAFDGDMNVGSTIDIGCIKGIGGFELNGTIRNVRIWQRQLSASELQAITS